jgi:hypothetical protein
VTLQLREIIRQDQLGGMSSEAAKENIAEGLVAPITAKNDAPSPVKASKKSRSLSMGPGALNVPLKEDSGNRRKVLTSTLVYSYELTYFTSLHLFRL